VLLAKQFIPAGTRGDRVLERGMYAAATLSRIEVEDGAIGDPEHLRMRVASSDIYPGAQLTAASFRP
jgi:hypothetical protein